MTMGAENEQQEVTELLAPTFEQATIDYGAVLEARRLFQRRVQTYIGRVVQGYSEEDFANEAKSTKITAEIVDGLDAISGLGRESYTGILPQSHLRMVSNAQYLANILAHSSLDTQIRIARIPTTGVLLHIDDLYETDAIPVGDDLGDDLGQYLVDVEPEREVTPLPIFAAKDTTDPKGELVHLFGEAPVYSFANITVSDEVSLEKCAPYGAPTVFTGDDAFIYGRVIHGRGEEPARRQAVEYTGSTERSVEEPRETAAFQWPVLGQRYVLTDVTSDDLVTLDDAFFAAGEALGRKHLAAQEIQDQKDLAYEPVRQELVKAESRRSLYARMRSFAGATIGALTGAAVGLAALVGVAVTDYMQPAQPVETPDSAYRSALEHELENVQPSVAEAADLPFGGQYGNDADNSLAVKIGALDAEEVAQSTTYKKPEHPSRPTRGYLKDTDGNSTVATHDLCIDGVNDFMAKHGRYDVSSIIAQESDTPAVQVVGDKLYLSMRCLTMRLHESTMRATATGLEVGK
jgi:hypothetical protein